MPWVAQIWDLMPWLCCVTSCCRCCCIDTDYMHIQGGGASWDSSGGKNISQTRLRCCEPSGLCSDVRVCKFQAADHSVNARVVSSRGFGGVASFRMFQLWIQEGATASALSTSHTDSVTKSFLHVGDAVVRRQDTSRTRVQVTQPLVGDACGVQAPTSQRAASCIRLSLCMKLWPKNVEFWIQ